MFSKFKPDFISTSSYTIDYEKLYAEGIRGVIFDIDNTLVAHDAPSNEEADELLKKLDSIGLKVFLLSNNDEDRVKLFLADKKIDYIYKARKPETANYYKALEIMKLEKNQVVAVGDQLLTDCMGAKNSGIVFYRVGILDPNEPVHIRFKRAIEKIIELFT